MEQSEFLEVKVNRRRRVSFEILWIIWGVLLVIVGVLGIWWATHPSLDEETLSETSEIELRGQYLQAPTMRSDDLSQVLGSPKIFDPKNFDPQTQGGIEGLIEGYELAE